MVILLRHSDWTVTGPLEWPLTVFWLEFRSVEGLPLPIDQLQRKKNAAFRRCPASPPSLFGIGRYTGVYSQHNYEAQPQDIP